MAAKFEAAALQRALKTDFKFNDLRGSTRPTLEDLASRTWRAHVFRHEVGPRPFS
jgi:hypothetical protein